MINVGKYSIKGVYLGIGVQYMILAQLKVEPRWIFLLAPSFIKCPQGRCCWWHWLDIGHCWLFWNIMMLYIYILVVYTSICAANMYFTICHILTWIRQAQHDSHDTRFIKIIPFSVRIVYYMSRIRIPLVLARRTGLLFTKSLHTDPLLQCFGTTKLSGQIIATSHDRLPPKGS